MVLKKAANHSIIILKENIKHEHLKLQNNNDKVLLVEDLHKSLFNRLFKITRDIILMQKLIFEN